MNHLLKLAAIVSTVLFPAVAFGGGGEAPQAGRAIDGGSTSGGPSASGGPAMPTKVAPKTRVGLPDGSNSTVISSEHAAGTPAETGK